MIIAENFDGTISELFKNERTNKSRNKNCRYSEEIKKFVATLHFYSPKAYNYCK